MINKFGGWGGGGKGEKKEPLCSFSARIRKKKQCSSDRRFLFLDNFVRYTLLYVLTHHLKPGDLRELWGAKPILQSVLYFYSFCRVFSSYCWDRKFSSLPSNCSTEVSKRGRSPERFLLVLSLRRSRRTVPQSPAGPWCLTLPSCVLQSQLLFTKPISTKRCSCEYKMCRWDGQTRALKGRCQVPVLFKRLNFNILASS